MLITLEWYSRSSLHLVCSITCDGATRPYAHKPEIHKTRWPPTPSWIFTRSWITRELCIRLSPNFIRSFASAPQIRF